jgi:biotin-dependent carboxylase-like uncharacterized protein
MSRIAVLRAGPLATIQDAGRPGQLVHGVSASGALDQSAFALAQSIAGEACGAAIEFSSLGLCFRYEGEACNAGFAGGQFALTLNGQSQNWPAKLVLTDGDIIDITTGPWGNYGCVRFNREIDCPVVMGSRSTNAVVGLGGFEGRALVQGDEIALMPLVESLSYVSAMSEPPEADHLLDSIRVVWSIHADLFSDAVRGAFVDTGFQVTARMDRMGVRLKDIGGVFAGSKILSLVSDSVVPGDIQILGDGTPIVLLRDHQPTGGYPRIATVITADIDRFVQIRPGKSVQFRPVTLATAHAALRAAGR